MTTDQFIKRLENDWKLILPEIESEAINTLTTNEIDFSTPLIDNIPNDFGVYLFQFYPNEQFDINDFKKNWKSHDSPIHAPIISKSRIQFDNHKKWYPFYIGKTEKLSNRINEHCFQESAKTTYGLKLSHRKELILNAKFCFSYFRITDDKTLNKNAIQFVMTNLEREIRNKIKPWIGKQ